MKSKCTPRKPSQIFLFLRKAINCILVLFLLSSSTFGSKAKPKSWNEKMRGLEETMQTLLIDLNSDERFNSPANFKRIEKNVEKFSKLAHSLQSKEGPSPDPDPSIKIISTQFAAEAAHAYKALKSGHRAYAKTVLQSMMSYCIACHTRNNTGPDFQKLNVMPAVQSLKQLEKADFFASTRQFDRAIEEYEKIIQAHEKSENRPFEWERAIRTALAIAVRVKKDPALSLRIVDRVIDTAKAPYFLKQQALQWKASLNEWKAEPPLKALNEEAYYTLATRLIAEANKVKKYPADRSSDILYLRASSAVHDLMSSAPNGKYLIDALYLAGLCYENLQDLNLWEIHEFYYLVCIMKSPHTDKARQCFKHYEQSVYRGFTGSSGTHLPADVKSKLKRLDQLSSPLPSKIENPSRPQS